jgi:hypothetical protein
MNDYRTVPYLLVGVALSASAIDITHPDSNWDSNYRDDPPAVVYDPNPPAHSQIVATGEWKPTSPDWASTGYSGVWPG